LAMAADLILKFDRRVGQLFCGVPHALLEC
jgi:hypothetical protein